MLERLAVHQLHGDEWHAVGITHVVYGADVGMVQRCGRARLVQKSSSRGGVAVSDARQELDGHVATEPSVASAIDHAHAACRERVDDLDVTIHFVKENAIVSRDSRSSDKLLPGIKC